MSLNRQTAERWIDTEDPSLSVYTKIMVYDAAGQLIRISDDNSTYGNGYDRLGRLASVDNLDQDMPDTPHVSFSALFDASGNRTTLVATVEGVQDFRNDYSYDALNRQGQKRGGQKRRHSDLRRLPYRRTSGREIK